MTDRPLDYDPAAVRALIELHKAHPDRPTGNPECNKSGHLFLKGELTCYRCAKPKFAVLCSKLGHTKSYRLRGGKCGRCGKRHAR